MNPDAGKSCWLEWFVEVAQLIAGKGFEMYEAQN
jgi:hypothetical protein